MNDLHGTFRQIENLKNYMNIMSKNIQFTCETEIYHRINYLDLSIIKKGSKFQYKINRKTTTTDITIHGDSHHHNQKIDA